MKGVLAGIGALALAVGVIAFPPQQTLASWGDNEYAKGSLNAGTLTAPTGLSCNGGGLLQAVTYSWTAPSTGVAPSGYHWTLVTKTLLGPASSGDVAATSVTIPASGIIGAGTSTFTVTSTVGGWSSATGPTGTYGVVNVALVGLVTSCSVP